MLIANFLDPIEEDQGAIEELDDIQIIEMVQLPEEEEQEELAEEIPQVSRTEKLKSLGMLISLLDISKEKDLEVYRHLKRTQNEIRYSSGTQTEALNYHRLVILGARTTANSAVVKLFKSSVVCPSP
ncbi:hypothetical protein K3495_g11353 [Podosphaera aphanis]|nr:hypothetical protein K3495_g11353 [Podosphaera aphanis]